MRQPTLRRRHSRQQRLLRTGIAIVGIVAIAAVLANLVGGDDATAPGGEDTARPGATLVAFNARYAGAGESAAPKREVAAEGERIATMLNNWYQVAFVDPSRYGDGTFPEVAAFFDAPARDQFTKDIASLTIGDARAEVAAVEPTKASARITVYFERGRRPRLAVADVDFEAVGTLKDASAPKLEIDQRATLHLKRTAKGWLVVWWTAEQTQEQVAPSPTPTGTAS